MCRYNFSSTNVRSVSIGGLEVWLETKAGILPHNVELVSRTLWIILSRVKDLDGYFHSVDVSRGVFSTWDIPHGSRGYYTQYGKRSFSGLAHVYSGQLSALNPLHHNKRNFCWRFKPGFVQGLEELGYIFVDDIDLGMGEEEPRVEHDQVVPPAHPEVKEAPEAPAIAFTERRYVTVSFGGTTYEDVLQHEPLCHLGAAIIQANDRENQITEAGLTMLQIPNVREAMLMAGLNALATEEDREAVLRELLAEQ